MKRFAILFCLTLICSKSFAADQVSFVSTMTVYSLQEIVVTATKQPRLRSVVPWNVSVADEKTIKNSTSKTLADVLKTEQGMLLVSNGGLGAVSSARLHGSTPQQVLILLDGIKMNSPLLGTADLNDILLNNIERVEVVKAPLSAIYGSDALGGVINIITKKPSNISSFKVSSGYGDYSTQTYGLSGQGKNYVFSTQTMSSAGYRPNSNYKASDLSLRISERISDYDIEFGIKKFSSDKGIPGPITFPSLKAKQNDNNQFVDLGIKTENGLKLSVSQNVLENKYEDPDWFTLSDHKATTNNLNVQQLIGVFNHNILAGLDIKNDSTNSTDSGRKSVDNSALFIQDEIFFPRFNLIAGARYDKNQSFGERISPRIGFSSNLSGYVVKGSYGTAFKAPSINDLYWAGPTYPSWMGGVSTTEGNPLLRPETSYSFDFSLGKEWEDDSSFDINLYKTEIKDIIKWQNISTSLVDELWTPVNIANALISGMEISYKKKLFGNLSMFANYTNQSAKDSGSDKYLIYSPQFGYNGGFSFDGEAVSSKITYRYVGERFSDASNTQQLPSYKVVDISLTRRFGSLEAKIDLSNAFNESYSETNGYPMPGRNYSLKISCNF